MASKRRLKRKLAKLEAERPKPDKTHSCLRKKFYATLEEAESAADIYNARNGTAKSAYHCHFCIGCHFGDTPYDVGRWRPYDS